MRSLITGLIGAAIFSVPGLVAGQQRRFTDVTAATTIRVNTMKRPGQPQYGTQMPHGVAIEDFDGDGRLDILLVCFGKPAVQLFRNMGNLRFVDVTKGSGLETFDGWGTGAAVADFDRDGILDVYLTSVQFERKNQSVTPAGKESRLYKGLGNGKFVDVSRKSGTLLKRPGRCCAWSDIDGDGWVDLFVACPYGPNVLFRNNRDGTFTDIAEKAGVTQKDRMSLGCVFGDIDNDGLDDLFIANYSSQVSALFKNLGGGRFREITMTAGVGRKAAAVGCVFADVFNRGKLDLYVTTDSWLSGANYTEKQLLQRGHTVEPNVLYRNTGRGKFVPVSAATLRHKTLSHDAILEDLDHDGFLDLYVGVDAIPTGNKFATSKGGNPAWTRADGKTWREVRAKWGVGFEANCVCVPAADFDNDGDLDLLLVNFYKNIVLYRNNTNDKNWLRVKAIGTKSNRDGIGARVSVYRTAGNKKTLIGTRYVHSGAGYGRSSPLETHFGLGRSADATYRVEVYFPATKTRVVKTNVKPGRRIVIRESEGKSSK
ncbi:MAG: CRTAC1 family protein [Planctomycetes bacterium]|nr:CRTAC1 family protein [Planctomycetota bacterium]